RGLCAVHQLELAATSANDRVLRASHDERALDDDISFEKPRDVGALRIETNFWTLCRNPGHLPRVRGTPNAETDRRDAMDPGGQAESLYSVLRLTESINPRLLPGESDHSRFLA